MKASSSTSSSTNVTSSSSRRLSGLLSGLDTDTLVKQLSAGTQAKINKLAQSKQLAAWKQNSYREVTTALQEFQTKYFSSSTSASNISSPSFFQTQSIQNTSSYLNISGNSTNAAKMKITDISQLAVQASFTSKHKVSSEAITSGKINDSYTKSLVAGASVTINYGGTDYAVSLDSEFSLDDPSDTSNNVTKVVNALNASISKTDSLAGKVEFSVNGDGKVTVNSTDLTKKMYISDGTSNLLSGLGLTVDKTKTAANSLLGSATQPKDFFNSSIASGSSLDFTIGGKSYTLELSDDVSLPASNTTEQNAKILQTALNTAISNNTDLKGKLTASVNTTTGAVSFTGATAITGGSQNMLKGLGLTLTGSTYSTTGTMDRDKLVVTHLQDALSGSSLTFSLDGVTKKITFNESEKNDYSTVAGLQSYLQTKLISAYGGTVADPNVTVAVKNGGLSFATKNTTSNLTLSSCDKSGVLGSDGALHIYAGESNRINTNKTLEDLSGSLKDTLTTGVDGTYGLTVNGKDFTFKCTDTLATVISTINNDSDANVTISYSSTQDCFNVTADNGGASSKVQISTLGGSNLATTLFGNQSGADASLNYDFTGKTKDTLDNKTIIIGSTVYEFTADGKLNDKTHTAINLSSASSSDDIATAFRNAVAADGGISGYATPASQVNGKVSFTKNAATDDYTATAGQNSKMKISFDGNAADAVEIERSENKFTIDEVNIDLLKTTDSSVSTTSPISFSIKNETDDLYKKVSDFITDYNSLLTLVNGKVNESNKTNDETFAPLTDDQKADMTETEITKWETNAKKGILQSDTLLTSLSYDCRNAMSDAVASVKSALYSVGITEQDYDQYGKLTIDETKFKDALTNNEETVASMFTSSDGIAARLQKIITKNINTNIGDDGLLVQKAGVASRNYDNSTLGTEMSDETTKIKELKKSLASEQDRYYTKFTTLESYLSKMNAQSSLFTSSSAS